MRYKLISILIIVVMGLSSVVVRAAEIETAIPQDEHIHSRELIEICVEENQGIEFCGKFYCEECQQEYYDSITTEDLEMPIINIEGSLDGITKENKVEVRIQYQSNNQNIQSFDTNATLKIQGTGSAQYPKKNYSLQLLNDKGKKNKLALEEKWGKQSKYCLKANYIDYSQSRNLVSGRIFSEIVKSREKEDELGKLTNGGAVDGYPIVMFLNGDFLGLYTLNIPKDKWMFGMSDESKKQAILMGDGWTTSTALKETIKNVDNVSDSGWEIEYCSTEEDTEVGTSWVGSSMNEFIDFLINNNGESLKKDIDKYTDVDRAIDVLIYTYFILAHDNTSRNILWVTYDGEKWIPSMYDMDSTWGLHWDGSFPYAPTDFAPDNYNLLFKRLLENYPEEIKTRYFELRSSVLTANNINEKYNSFINGINNHAYIADGQKWQEIPSQDTNNIQQITSFTEARIEFLDNWFNDTSNYTKSFFVEAHEHQWDSGTVTVNATCTGNGYKTHNCTVEGCTATTTSPIYAHGHNIIKTKKVNPTCCTYGYKSHYECEYCHTCYIKKTVKKKGKKQTTWKTTSLKKYRIKKKKHSYTKKIASDQYLKKRSTLTNKSIYYKSCKWCGKKGKSVFTHATA